MSVFLRMDWAILNWIHANCTCGVFDVLMPRITVLADSGAVWIALALALCATRRYRRRGALVLVGLTLGLLLGNVVLKTIFERARPCWLNTSVRLLIPVPDDFSFPSGHALASAVAAAILADENRIFALASVSLAGAIAFSRLYLYVHFPSDVLAAVLLGAVIGWFVVRADRKAQKYVLA